MRTREELAWAAGFFDGEGWAGGWVGADGYGCVQLGVSQASKDGRVPRVLERFVEAFGILVQIRSKKVPKGKDHWKPQWTVTYSSYEHVQAVSAMMWTWLGEVKREQILTGIARAEVMRIAGKPRDYCRNGHYMGDAYVRYEAGRRYVKYRCRTCQREAHRRWEEKRRAAHEAGLYARPTLITPSRQ